MSLDISNFENDLQPIELKAGKTRISFTILQTSEMQNAISNLSFNSQGAVLMNNLYKIFLVTYENFGCIKFWLKLHTFGAFDENKINVAKKKQSCLNVILCLFFTRWLYVKFRFSERLAKFENHLDITFKTSNLCGSFFQILWHF